MPVTSTAPRAASRRLWVLKACVGAIIALGVFFRFYHVDHKAFWDDEVVTWLHIHGVSEGEVVSKAGDFHRVADLRAVLHPPSGLRPLPAVIGPMRNEDPQHPPVYYLIAHAWVALFGDSLAVVRSLSAIIGVLAIPCMYWLCVELFGSRAAGWAGAALVASAPIDVLYSQEAREYSLWLVCIMVSSALFIRAIRANSLPAWGLYSGALGLSLYVFPLSIFVSAAHAAVALCARTSLRTRGLALGAMAAGLLLFAPWLLVIVSKIADINASNPAAIVDPAATRWQTLTKAVSLIRLDVIDLNGAQRSLVLAATLPIIALLGFAVYDLRRWRTADGRFFVWALLGCAALPFIGLDLLLGGHRTETARYFTPLFLALDLALAALVASRFAGGNRPRAHAVWAGIFGLVFALRIASCAMSAQAASWWNSYNIHSREIAAQINAAHRPLVMSDDYVVWPLMLSEYLDPRIEVALRPRCYQCKLPSAGSPPLTDLARGDAPRDIFLIAPSPQLQAVIQAQSERLKPARVRVNCIRVRSSCPGGIELWYSGS
jgi:uncharacterized membrane protein